MMNPEMLKMLIEQLFPINTKLKIGEGEKSASFDLKIYKTPDYKIVFVLSYIETTTIKKGETNEPARD